jgi:glycosyltransferase involved in cell wall biosynthesis
MASSHGPAADSRGGRLRVALVTETYPPEINGVAMTVARIVHGLAARGHQVDLVRPRQGSTDVPGQKAGVAELLTRGLPIPRYPELKVGLPARRRLERSWREARPDVVHLATEGPLGWSALRAARRLGVPVVSEFRTNFHAYSRHYGIGFLRQPIFGYLRGFHNRTACTMVPTAALARDLEATGFERLRVVARGVDTQLFDPARRSPELRASWGADSRTLVVIGVGRLAPEKNLGLLATAFGRIKAARPDAKLVLVGDGPARGAMQAQCPDAVFAGRRLGEDLATHYASADLLLFPSITETFGNVTLEGMASGLGVVAFGYGAAGEVIRSGDNGWTVPYGDEDAFLETAVAASEVATLGRLGSQARTDVCRLGWDQIVGQIETHYATALESAGVRRRPAGQEIPRWKPVSRWNGTVS